LTICGERLSKSFLKLFPSLDRLIIFDDTKDIVKFIKNMNLELQPLQSLHGDKPERNGFSIFVKRKEKMNRIELTKYLNELLKKHFDVDYISQWTNRMLRMLPNKARVVV